MDWTILFLISQFLLSLTTVVLALLRHLNKERQERVGLLNALVLMAQSAGHRPSDLIDFPTRMAPDHGPDPFDGAGSRYVATSNAETEGA